VPDFVQTSPYDPTIRGHIRGMVAKTSTKHDLAWIAWRMVRAVLIRPAALAGVVVGGWLVGHGIPFPVGLALGALPQIGWAGRVPLGLLAVALRRRSYSFSKGERSHGARAALVMWWRIRNGWPTGTREIGFCQPGRGGQIPWLRRWEITGTGLSAQAICGRFGWTADELAAKSQVIAAGIKRCRGVVVTQQDYPGVARIDFAFTDPLAEIIPITALPAPKRGRLSCGVTERGEPAMIHNYLSTLVVGLPGSGKSNLLWTLITSMLAAGEPFELWVLDPAGGVELWELSQGSPLVREYAAEPAAIRAQIRKLHDAMFARMRRMAGKERLHIPTEAEPRMYWVVDEWIQVWAAARAGDNSKTDYVRLLLTILSLCRKAAITPIALTQIPFGHTIGDQVRTLFPQKVIFRVHDHTVTGAVFGAGVEQAGMAASRIPLKTPGVGYLITDEDPKPYRFRAPLVTDAMAGAVAKGMLPDGIPTSASVVRHWHNNDHVLYRWDTPPEGVQLPGREELYFGVLYVGISVDGARRADEHLSNTDKAVLRTPGVMMTIVSRFTEESCAESLATGRMVRDVAEEWERDLIRELEPPLNVAHNPGRKGRSRAIEEGHK
jgi:S-DNA-T family DNA segregation ATPase FtsK/SpoIIIE